jgi:anti-anti-sigma factor
MKIIQNDGTVKVNEIEQLAAANAALFESSVRAALPNCPRRIDIDLSQTDFVDCGGVGALVAVRKCARQRNAQATVHLLNPGVSARCLLKLTRMDFLFPIEPR